MSSNHYCLFLFFRQPWKSMHCSSIPLWRKNQMSRVLVSPVPQPCVLNCAQICWQMSWWVHFVCYSIYSCSLHLTGDDSILIFDCIFLSLFKQIEEMNMNNIKVEEHEDKKVFITNEQKKDQQVKQLSLRMQRVKKKIMNPRKLWKIARDYAALYSDELRHPSPFPRFRGSTIIQCPACMVPRNDNSRSEFLHLLRHVEKRHPESSSFLFAEVSKMYWPLIECMEKKIFNSIRENYSIRLRPVVSTSN